jgi:hypothetical protein
MENDGDPIDAPHDPQDAGTAGTADSAAAAQAHQAVTVQPAGTISGRIPTSSRYSGM